MKRFFLLINILIYNTIFATEVVHDEQYYKYKKNDVEIIFTKDNLEFAKQTSTIEPKLHEYYQDTYGWVLDETLYIGLLSHRNQIPNGFSTQLPNNKQMNYVGGVQNIDYFCSTSWLDTLLYHESAHNYQLNVKANPLSRFLHSIFGNGFVLSPMPFIVPNLMENSFMLEGNAVLNESWHGNGGRLYSGRFKAQTILQAKAGNITPQNTYNTTLNFPYSETYYITGGFYNLYMAQKYGLDNINRYFHQHSKLFVWPQLTNHSMKVTTGDYFKDSLEDFASEYASKKLNIAKGKKLFSSQFYYQLNNDKDEIFFIINKDGVSSPELIRVDKQSLKVSKQKDSWLSGKVIKKENQYYTVGSNYTSAFNIYQGLYDSDADILESSKSKIIQGYLSDNTEVYFDVKSSFSEAKLYIGNSFYETVNSSVFIDANDNLYYFKQNAKTRTLYKNKTPIYYYKGFYGIVSDVDSKNNIYFIANSKNGSTLYRYSNAKVNRVLEADNIIEAKLIGDDKVFLSAIGKSEYYYLINELTEIEQTPYETKLFFENKDYYAKTNYKNLPKNEHINLDKKYNSFFDMHYSGTNLFIGSNDNDSTIGNISINFADPLGQNQSSFFLNKDSSEVLISGLSYSSKEYLFNYSLSAYGVLDDANELKTRDYGLMANIKIPFIKFARYYGELGLNYFQDYDTLEREPLSIYLNLSRYEHYGKSRYLNYLNSLELYTVNERNDNIYGGIYNFSHDLPYETYINLGAKYSKTDTKITSFNANINKRGVKVSDASNSIYDNSQIQIPNLIGSLYIQEAGYVEAKLSSVINFSKYYFTFPLSIQRESIYTKYRYYELKSFSQNRYKMNETTIGISLSLVGLNSFAFPLNLEYIYNDGNSRLIEDSGVFRFILEVNF
ncbi:hypothetical protein FJR48_06270 [Sulfurimonas lithotrophica]|uniref:Uncharacterized protein n=1 Tax=Sulfurimonas lithotrophica TaxID=2590022 RepID=A0A5P8P0W6_9BACT|nr:hypothetical protein [Sulfurimonas lithotrophica]QFR49352.1 hypothetical protein FJR48_06270 [Sulfurimonas lithotrophica]